MALFGPSSNTGECLKRVARVLPPLDLEGIRQVEASDVSNAKKVGHGAWQHYRCAAATALVCGPRHPTAHERALDLDDHDESVTLDSDCLRRSYQPTQEVLNWIDEHVDQRSKEGPRQSATF